MQGTVNSILIFNDSMRGFYGCGEDGSGTMDATGPLQQQTEVIRPSVDFPEADFLGDLSQSITEEKILGNLSQSIAEAKYFPALDRAIYMIWSSGRSKDLSRRLP